MPLDPVLARGLTPITAPQAPDPANQFAKIIQMENLRSQMETNALTRQKNQMEMEDRNALRAALASPDPAAALMGIPGGAGEVEARAKLDTAKMERMLKVLSVGNEYLARARDQQSYDAARQAVESLSPGSTRSWASQYSPEGVQSLLQDAATIRKLNEPTDFDRMVRAAGIQPGTPEAQALARRKLDKDVYIAPTEASLLPSDVRTAQWLSTQPPEIQALYFKSKRGENAPDASVVARTETDDDGTVHQFNAYGKEIATSAGAGKTKGGGLKTLPSPVARAVMENEHSLRLARNALTLIQGGKVGEQAGSKAATGVKGFLPDAALSRLDPEGVPTRAAIADLGSMIIHDRSGAAVTASEYPRLMPFIPKANDDPPVVEQKLKRFIQVYEDMQQDFRDMYSEDQGYQFPELSQTPPSGKNPPPTEEDIAYTAKKYNMSPDEVRRRLGMQ